MAAVLFFFLLFLSFLPPSFSQNPTSLALLKFKKSFTNTDSLTNWKDDASSSPCAPNNEWIGLICTTDMVSIINLAGMGLQGAPDVAALAPLDSLKSITLDNNSLQGPIPDFNRLPSLKAIYASDNQFSGDIPDDYFQTLGSLKKLWLSNNKFSGPIPKSVGELSNLKELHLDRNEFSGPIPDFSDIDVLNALDLSNNKLEGPIPGPMNKFDGTAFENNPGLCGPKASKPCPKTESQSKSTKWIIAAIALALLIMIIMLKTKRKEENVRNSGKENIDEAVVTIPSTTTTTTTRKNNSFGRKPYSSGLINKSKAMDTSRKGASQLGKSGGEIVMVNEDRGAFGLQDLMKAAAEVLGNGGLGSAYKATLETGVSVVVKRVKEMNKMSKEAFDAEMRKLGRLKHQNILTPLAYYFRKDDKFLVSEYVPQGSLLYVLHGDRGTSHSQSLNWANRLKIIKGVARGMSYLHSEFASYELPHGNLKSCNVLIGKDHEPLLSDYALHPLVNDTPTAQCMFAYRSPEATLHQRVSHKSDVYCLGIIILEMVTGKYPSQYLNNQKEKGGTDVVQWVRSALDEKREGELIDQELASAAKQSVRQMEKLLHIGAACTENEVDARIEMKEAITRIEEISV